MTTCPLCGGPLGETDILVSLETNSVSCGWVVGAIALTAREAELLAILVGKMPLPVPIDRIITRMWGADEGACAQKNVHVLVRRLRAKLAGVGLKIDHCGAGTGYLVRNYAGSTDPQLVARLAERIRRVACAT